MMLHRRSIAEIDARPLQSLADAEMKGAACGLAAARLLLNDPNASKPCTIENAPRSWSLAAESAIAEQLFIFKLLRTGFNNAGEAAFRRGFRRGVRAQLANPNGIVEIREKTS